MLVTYYSATLFLFLFINNENMNMFLCFLCIYITNKMSIKRANIFFRLVFFLKKCWFILIVCLKIFTHKRIYTHMETSPLPIKGCKFLTQSRPSGQLDNKYSFACQTYCDLEIPVIWSFLCNRDTHTSCPAFGSRVVTTLLTFRMHIEDLNRPNHRLSFSEHKRDKI